MIKKVGRNQPCSCGSGKKFKLCCDSHNTNLKYWEKNVVSKSNNLNTETLWKPKTNKGKINFNSEFEKVISDRNKLFDEVGGDEFKDVMVSDWLGDFKPYTDSYKTKQETWDDTSKEWIENFNRTHDRWRKLISEKDDDTILIHDLPINLNRTHFLNDDSDGDIQFKMEDYSIDRTKDCYEKMLKEYDDICLDKLVLDKVKKVKGGWFKPKNPILKLRTCDVDINNTNIWCVFNDYCYSHLEWLNKWKEELIELVPIKLISIFMRDWYFKLGLPLNKVELKEGHLDELFQFFTKIKETSDSSWGELGMNKCYEFLHSNSGKGMEEWGGRNFCIVVHPHNKLQGLSGGNDKGITTKSDNEMVTIYRNVLDLEYKDGFSWSTDSSQSLKWGLSRNYVGCSKDKGYLLEGEVMKKDIMGYTNHNDDKGGMNEVFVHPSKITITKTTELNEETIKEIVNTDEVVRKDLLHHWLSGLNMKIITMWDKICDYEHGEQTTLMKQQFLSRLVQMKQTDKDNITKSIEQGTIVMDEIKDTKRPKVMFVPQTSKDMKLVRNKKLMFQTQQKLWMLGSSMMK